MLGRKDTELLASLHPSLQAIITQPTQSSDRDCMMVILKIVNETNAAKREAVWLHFENKVGKSIRHLIPQMHAAYNSVEASIMESPSQKRLRKTKARAAAMKTLDGPL